MKPAYIALGAAICMTAVLAAPATSDTPAPPPQTKVFTPVSNSCDDVSLSVYFPAHETMMSSYALRTISAAGDRLEGCSVQAINANVVSEEGHTEEALARLSEARADAVIQALNSNGISSPETHREYANVPVDAQSPARPMARRVVVTVKASPAYGS